MGAPARVGVDVGGTKSLGVALDAGGVVQASVQRPTAVHFDDLVDTVAGIVEELVAAGELGDDEGDTATPVGVGLPGLVDRQGRLFAAPHLEDPIDLEPIEAAARLTERLRRPVLLDNDATCATLAEWRLGAGRGLDNFVLVTLGTGIGGGVVADGTVLRGERGFAGELGHIQVDPLGPPCSCGKRGCWETFASGNALGERARQAARRGELAGVVARATAMGEEITGELVQVAAGEGDDGARAVVDGFAREVAVGLSSLTNIFDPAAFVLGGGLAAARDVLVGPLARWLDELLYSAARRPKPEFRFAELGPQAGAIGAALLSSDR